MVNKIDDVQLPRAWGHGRRGPRSSLLAAAAPRTVQGCPPFLLRLLASGFMQRHRLAGHEEARPEVGLKVGYVLLVDHAEAARVGVSVHRHVQYHCER